MRGEVVADLLEVASNSGTFQSTLGGSAFLSALGAKPAIAKEKFDADVGFVGSISTDSLGQRFFDKLTKSDIDTRSIRRVSRNTTLTMVSIKAGIENAFSFYSHRTASEMVRIEELPSTLAEDQKICCLGSIFTVMEPARFAWLQFAHQQRSIFLIYYDLNTRPAIAKDPHHYRSLVFEWAQTADIMKASDADLNWAYLGKTLREVADIWFSSGAHLAVFTKGSKGSEVFTPRIHVTGDAPGLITTHTVGAGDNFNAGCAVHLAKENCYTRNALYTLTEA